VQGVEPNANPQNTALQRYWTLTETGDLTSNLTFNYLDADVPSGTAESSLKLEQYEGFFNQWPATIDINADTVTTTTPVSQFSDWTLLPTIGASGPFVVSGRVFDTSGLGVRNARVVFADQSGNTRTTLTNAFGYYYFDNIDSGSTFIASVSYRRFTYAQRVVQVFNSLSDVNFTPQ
jgi:hypothetical protein